MPTTDSSPTQLPLSTGARGTWMIPMFIRRETDIFAFDPELSCDSKVTTADRDFWAPKPKAMLAAKKEAAKQGGQKVAPSSRRSD